MEKGGLIKRANVAARGEVEEVGREWERVCVCGEGIFLEPGIMSSQCD